MIYSSPEFGNQDLFKVYEGICNEIAAGGSATAANQVTGNTTLTSINTKLQAIQNYSNSGGAGQADWLLLIEGNTAPDPVSSKTLGQLLADIKDYSQALYNASTSVGMAQKGVLGQSGAHTSGQKNQGSSAVFATAVADFNNALQNAYVAAYGAGTGQCVMSDKSNMWYNPTTAVYEWQVNLVVTT